MKCISVVVMLCICSLTFSQSTAIHITEISQNDIKNAIIVDVRTPAEYNSGHLEHALNINWYDADFASKFEGIDKDKTIYVYCKVGGRSAKAQKKLLSLGYTNVINLEGGYNAVLREGN